MLGRKEKKSFVIVQSVKNTDTAKEKGYDEKISGIKRYVAVDIIDFPHAISLTKANVRKGVLNMFYLYHDNLNNIQNILAGYSGDKFADSGILHCPVEITGKNTLHTFSVIRKRWIVHLHD